MATAVLSMLDLEMVAAPSKVYHMLAALSQMGQRPACRPDGPQRRKRLRSMPDGVRTLETTYCTFWVTTAETPAARAGEPL